mmetsp:Transcript_54118/g.90158  ORF Transcript_54118/g.90158 Transcript_54118/m.90158 type:complete len:323 (-) Transcript_54118:1509-2477(-)
MFTGDLHNQHPFRVQVAGEQHLLLLIGGGVSVHNIALGLKRLMLQDVCSHAGVCLQQSLLLRLLLLWLPRLILRLIFLVLVLVLLPCCQTRLLLLGPPLLLQLLIFLALLQGIEIVNLLQNPFGRHKQLWCPVRLSFALRPHTFIKEGPFKMKYWDVVLCGQFGCQGCLATALHAQNPQPWRRDVWRHRRPEVIRSLLKAVELRFGFEEVSLAFEDGAQVLRSLSQHTRGHAHGAVIASPAQLGLGGGLDPPALANLVRLLRLLSLPFAFSQVNWLPERIDALHNTVHSPQRVQPKHRQLLQCELLPRQGFLDWLVFRFSFR